VAQRVPGGIGSQISWHSAHEGGEVVSLTHRPPFLPGMFLVLIFTWAWVDHTAVVRSEGDMSPGIDPGTIRLVAQRLKHYATPGPTFKTITHLLPTSSYEDIVELSVLESVGQVA
jgi:hypothetical protein